MLFVSKYAERWKEKENARVSIWETKNQNFTYQNNSED